MENSSTKNLERELPTINWHLNISYRGTNYCGWQKQNGQHLLAVQDLIEDPLRELFSNNKLQLNSSGRTDAGVHALSQHASFSTPTHPHWTAEKLKTVLNRRTPSDIAINSVDIWQDNQHARFSSLGKTYAYLFYSGNDKSPLFADLFHRHRFELDWAKIDLAIKELIGTHDFSAFAAKKKLKIDNCTNSNVEFKEDRKKYFVGPDKPKGNIRTIYNIECIHKGDWHAIFFTGSGFLYKMVRSLMGHLFWIGEGKCDHETTKELIKSCIRTNMVETAPPHGLYLVDVFYEKNQWINSKLGFDYFNFV